MSNKELKTRGKFAFRRFYWRSVLVALIMYLLCAGGLGDARDRITQRYEESSYTEYYGGYDDFDIDYDIESIEDLENLPVYIEQQLNQYIPAAERVSPVKRLANLIFSGIFLFGASVFSIVWILVSIFVFKPLEVGADRYFIENAEGRDAQADLLGFAFKQRKDNYLNIVLGLFLRELYTLLWSCLFIIPGIVKNYSYKLVPFLLADYPDMPQKEAFRLSMAMMNGNKARAFGLDISFIGWFILDSLTLGLVGIFYSNPYRYAAYTEFYLDVSTEYHRRHSGNASGQPVNDTYTGDVEDADYTEV